MFTVYSVLLYCNVDLVVGVPKPVLTGYVVVPDNITLMVSLMVSLMHYRSGVNTVLRTITGVAMRRARIHHDTVVVADTKVPHPPRPGYYTSSET
jgi:hypothetical protein